MDELLRLKAARENSAATNVVSNTATNSAVPAAPKTKRERLNELLLLVVAGKITDADYKDKPISLYGRNSASGTYGYFKEHVLANKDFAAATQTLATHARTSVLAAIGDGSLEPGGRYSVAQLAEQLGVSRTPVREALRAGDADRAAAAMRYHLRRTGDLLAAQEDAASTRP